MATSGRLRTLREANGLTLRQLAELAKIDQGQLSRVERGLEPPTVRLLAAVARILKARDLAQALETLRRYGVRC